MKLTTITISKCAVQGIKYIVEHVSYHVRGAEGDRVGQRGLQDVGDRKSPMRRWPGDFG